MTNSTFIGSNINIVKASNLRAILLNLLYKETFSRVQLAKEISLSATTITNLIDELMQQGVVKEDYSILPTTSERKVGRPRTALRLVPNARFAIGLYIGIGVYRVGVVNLVGEVCQSRRLSYDINLPPKQVLNDMADQIESVVEEYQIERNQIIGIGVGSTGLVDYHTGVNLFAPNLGWHDIPIQQWLNERIKLPVIVDNNVRAMALGENFFGMGREVSSLVFVYGRFGVGAGIVINNQIYRGVSLNAGEIGHTIIIPDSGEPCRCGKQGCLETLVSEGALLRQANIAIKNQPDSLLASYLMAAKEDPIECIFTAARDGDPVAGELVHNIALHLGLALANLVNILNPELIVFGGMFAQGEDLLLPVVQKTIREAAMSPMGDLVKIKATENGWKAGLIGAAGLALMAFFYQPAEEV